MVASRFRSKLATADQAASSFDSSSSGFFEAPTDNVCLFAELDGRIGCLGSDTINMTVNAKPVVNLGPDTTLCAAYTLDAGNAGSTFL